jgi:hypothetical protein
VTSVDVEFDEDSLAVRIWRAVERDAGQETSSGRVGLQVLSST